MSGSLQVEMSVSSFAFNIQSRHEAAEAQILHPGLAAGVVRVAQHAAAEDGMLLGQGGQLLQELGEEGGCQHGVPDRRGQAGGRPRHLGSVRHEGLKHSRGAIQEVLAASCPGGVLDGI